MVMKKIMLMCFVVAGIAPSQAVADGGTTKDRLTNLREELRVLDLSLEWTLEDKQRIDQLVAEIKKEVAAEMGKIEMKAAAQWAARKERLSKTIGLMVEATKA